MALQTLPRRIGLMLPVTRLWPSSTQLTPTPRTPNSVQKACALELARYSMASPQAAAIRRTIFFIRVRRTAREVMAVASTPARKVAIRICMGISEGTYLVRRKSHAEDDRLLDRTSVQLGSAEDLIRRAL